MEQTLKNIQKISLIFFIIIGLTHIVSNLLIANGSYLSIATLIAKILDIPFIATGLLYGLSSLRLSLVSSDKNSKMLNAILIGLGCAILLAALSVNIFFKDISIQ